MFLKQGISSLREAAAQIIDELNSNLSRLDMKILLCLKRNADNYMAIETDQNLGIAICSSNSVGEQVRKHIESSDCQIDADELAEIMRRLRISFDCLTNNALCKQTIAEGQYRFLRTHIYSDTIPLFRISAKIHKTPVDSRPISNLRGFVLGPASNFANAAILSIQQLYTTIATSTLDMVMNFENEQLAEDEFLMTFDITSLYPNLNIDDERDGV